MTESSSQKTLFLLLVGVMLCGANNVSQLEIQTFQPAVVPVRAVTTLTLQTNKELNMTSNSSLQCRFKDISMPARVEDGFILCDTPPIRNTDRVSVHLDIDGKLFKAKKPLYLHEPFKVANVTPSVVSPAQTVQLTVSGISCEDWMQYFVRFQTVNGTKKTQQGICKDSIVSCYVPEFAPDTRLRVGLTLSNREVQWADAKILIQYPIDAIRSSVQDVQTNITKKGAFNFRVAPKDRYKNTIRVADKGIKKHAKISVQYSSYEEPKTLKFLQCNTTTSSEADGDAYVLSCAGADKEHIFFYPSINNVPLGGQDKYEARTTLCPGRSSCREAIHAVDHKSSPPILEIVLGVLAFLLLLVVVAACFVIHRNRTGRYSFLKGRKTVHKSGGEQLEMDSQQSEPHPGYSAFYPQLDQQKQSAAGREKVVSQTEQKATENSDSSSDSPETYLDASNSQTDKQKEAAGFNQPALAKHVQDKNGE